MSAYYHSFDVVLIDAAGIRQPVLDTDVEVYNVTQSSAITTLTTDGYGIIPEGSLTANVFDVVEFSVTGYSGTFRQTVQATQALAYTAVENDVHTLVIGNLFETTNPSELGDIQVIDLNDPNTPPQRLGQVKAGVDNRFPYSVTALKQIRIGLSSVDNVGQRSEFAIEQMRSVDLTIPGPSSAKFDVLFDQYADATTAGTTRETLYNYPMPTGVLDHAGDKIAAEYAGVFAANGNSKRVLVSFAGTDIFDSAVLTENNTNWSVKATVIRVSDTTARAVVNFASGVHFAPVYNEVTGLSLDSTGYNLNLDARSATSAGDVTAKMGYGMLVPRVPQTQFGTQLSRFSLSLSLGVLGGAPSVAELGGLYMTFEPGEARHYVYSDPPEPGDDWGDLELEPPVS